MTTDNETVDFAGLEKEIEDAAKEVAKQQRNVDKIKADADFDALIEAVEEFKKAQRAHNAAEKALLDAKIAAGGEAAKAARELIVQFVEANLEEIFTPFETVHIKTVEIKHTGEPGKWTVSTMGSRKGSKRTKVRIEYNGEQYTRLAFINEFRSELGDDQRSIIQKLNDGDLNRDQVIEAIMANMEGVTRVEIDPE